MSPAALWRGAVRRRRLTCLTTASALLAATVVTIGVTSSMSQAEPTPDNSAATTTPIKHVVVLFDENVSFDHYFATYPYAANTDGTSFRAAPDTPQDVDTELNAGLLPGAEAPAHNPNDAADDTPNPNAYQPQRLAPADALTCDQNHNYGPEQQAVNLGAMDKFVESVNQVCANTGTYSDPGLVMQYFDGNSVTGLWNYAQNYAMSDNNWNTVFGPSTPGHLNLISGNTYSGTTSVISDPDPAGDTCGSGTQTMSGANVGDLLNDKGVTWGWFQGGFADCTATHQNVAGNSVVDYSAHHDPFMYYASTANPDHTRPASEAEVGHDGAANHNYDLTDFTDALDNEDGASLPAVSFLKAPEYQDGHAGYSDPLDEQTFLTSQIDAIMASSYWPSTAIVIAYDDSDGWYDHVAPVIQNASSGFPGDGTVCTKAAANGVPVMADQGGRCGPSQRLPLLVISPYAKKNYVSHSFTNQVSILRFIEDNWQTKRIDEVSSVKGSFDTSATSLDDFFDWTHPQGNQVVVDSTLDSPTFGAVTGKPAATSVPIPSPTVSVATSVLTLPMHATLPSEQDFLTQVGAAIDAGTAQADLSGVDPDTAGTYDVEVGGSNENVPVTAPVTVQVRIAPVVALQHPTLSFPLASAAPTATYIRSAAGASITSGTLDTPDLSGVDWNVAGVYPVQITGRSAGVDAIPATLLIAVGDTAPRVVLTHDTIGYAVGDTPTAAEVAAAAGAVVPDGTVSPISLADVDFARAGDYSVPVAGTVSGSPVVPATLTIRVIPRPVVSVGLTTLTTAVGTALTSDQVLAGAFAATTAGALDPVVLSGVDFTTPGDYAVAVTASELGVAAVPAAVVIRVQSRADRVSTATRVKAVKKALKSKRKLRLIVTTTAGGTVPGGTITLYDKGKRVATAALRGGRATFVRKHLKRGAHRFKAGYGGSATTLPSTSRVVKVKVRR